MAEYFMSRARGLYDEKRYFRFNVDQGLQDVGLAEFLKQGAIEAATDRYIKSQTQKYLVRDCALNLKHKRSVLVEDFS